MEDQETNSADGFELFNVVRGVIKLPENYKPRGYQTIGGMWNVDTWQYQGVLFQIMDEGWFEQIIFGDKKVFVSWGRGNSIEYKNTNKQEFTEFANNFIEKGKN